SCARRRAAQGVAEILPVPGDGSRDRDLHACDRRIDRSGSRLGQEILRWPHLLDHVREVGQHGRSGMEVADRRLRMADLHGERQTAATYRESSILDSLTKWQNRLTA